MPTWRLATTTLDLDPSHPIGAGIVNVTGDSMYAGARSVTPERAVADGERLAAAGFELIDVGAVAAASGPPVPADAEAAQLLPAVRGLAERLEIPITADTFNPEVARAVAAAGAEAINDIGGGRDEMLEAIAEAGCGYVLMHIEGAPREDRPAPAYPDVVARICELFAERLERAAELGVPREAIALDPGLDFDLSTDHAIEILRRLRELRALGRPIFISLSRKDFLGAILAGGWEARAGTERRGAATLAAAAIAAANGTEIHRLHDPEALDAIRVAAAIAFDPISAAASPAASPARASGPNPPSGSRAPR